MNNTTDVSYYKERLIGAIQNSEELTVTDYVQLIEKYSRLRYLRRFINAFVIEFNDILSTSNLTANDQVCMFYTSTDNDHSFTKYNGPNEGFSLELTLYCNSIYKILIYVAHFKDLAALNIPGKSCI